MSVLMVKEVTDCGNLANEGIRDRRVPIFPKKDTLSTFVNYGVHLKNFLREAQIPDVAGGTLLRYWEPLEPSRRIHRIEGDSVEEVPPTRWAP